MNRNQSKSPGLIKLATMLALVAIIAVKTIGAILMIAVKTVDGIKDARQN